MTFRDFGTFDACRERPPWRFGSGDIAWKPFPGARNATEGVPYRHPKIAKGNS